MLVIILIKQKLIVEGEDDANDAGSTFKNTRTVPDKSFSVDDTKISLLRQRSEF